MPSTRWSDGRIARPLAHAAGVALIVLGWALTARVVDATIVLPGPLATVAALWRELTGPAFYRHLLATLVRAIAGFGLAFLGGVAWGLVAGSRSPVGAVLAPSLILIRATPVIAVILLALIWFRSAIAPVFVTILMVLPVVVGNVSAGTRAASGELREMARAFGVPARRQVRDLVIPALRSYLVAAARSGLGMAFKVTVAAEVLVQPPWALGGAMQEARFYLDTPRILGLTIAVIGLSALAELALRGLDRALPAHRGRRYRSRGLVPVESAVRTPSDPAVRSATLSVSLLAKGFERRLVIDGLSFVARPGEVTVVLGPSGCGKTTLLRLVAGLERPERGEIRTPEPVAVVFQEPRLLPWATARENVRFVLPEAASRERIDALFDAVDLPGIGEARPGALSGGMQQRVALARAFARDAASLLLDEPFQNLDLPVKLRLAARVRESTLRSSLVTLMVTHDVVEAIATADRIIILDRDPARIAGERRVSLDRAARDPRSVDHQRLAAELYDLLLSAR